MSTKTIAPPAPVLERQYQELAIDVPETATDLPFPVPEGMKAWKNRNGFAVVACHYTADPKKRNNRWYTKACQNLRDDQIQRELEINFDSKAGTKAFPYLEHNADLFRLDPPDPIPRHWDIICGLDYGSRNPTSAHLYAIDEFRNYWSFDEYYEPSNVYKIAAWLKNHRYSDRIEMVHADPIIFNKNQNVKVHETGMKPLGMVKSIAELLIEEGWHLITKGNNSRLTGLERVRLMFNFGTGRETAKPFLFIGRRCKKQWWELCNLVHKPDDKDTTNPEEDVVKRNDHAFDDLKYALLARDVPSGSAPLTRNGSDTLASLEEEIEERYDKQNRDDDDLLCAYDGFESDS